MSENINLTYDDFSAGQVAGDGMTIIDEQTTLEDIENGAIIYYFNDNGEIISHQFGGDS